MKNILPLNLKLELLVLFKLRVLLAQITCISTRLSSLCKIKHVQNAQHQQV